MSGGNENTGCEQALSIYYGYWRGRLDIRDLRESPAEFCGRIKTMKDKNRKNTTEIKIKKKNKRESGREIIGVGNDGYQLYIT